MKDIKGFEGKYAITQDGKVWSYYSEKFMSPRYDKDGYLRVNLRMGKKQKTVYVHRLVAEAFIPNPEGKETVNHLDECKTNNHVDNLEWATRTENVNYGTRTTRAALALSKPVRCIELDRVFESMAAASAELNVCSSGISNCCRGKAQTAGKYHWEYA